MEEEKVIEISSKPLTNGFVNHNSLNLEGLQTQMETQVISKRYVKSFENETSEDLTLGLSSISINGDYQDFPTYRCKSVTSLMSGTQLKSTRIERRCRLDDQEDYHSYDLTDPKVVQISGSLSSSSLLSTNGVSLARKLAYDQWLQKKNQETARKKRELDELEMKKKLEEEKLQQEKEERERRDRENFLSWVDRKRDDLRKRNKLIEKKSEIEVHLKELEVQALAAKEVHLRDWYRKKEKEQKAVKQQQEMKLKELENEKKKREEESAKAFAVWRDKTKHRSRPATQGLLPHQQAKPAYVNPNPWIVDDSVEVERNP